jgi:hypothetical protein
MVIKKISNRISRVKAGKYVHVGVYITKFMYWIADLSVLMLEQAPPCCRLIHFQRECHCYAVGLPLQLEIPAIRQSRLPTTRHFRHIRIQGDHNNSKMERMNGEERDREKTMRGLKMEGQNGSHTVIHSKCC